ncbi:MAG: uracil-DNA glycosylase [Candidatus Thorarchaeota archaeon]|jgi:DNA polymerase
MTRQKELDRIHEEIETCEKCPLHITRLNPVPGEGPVDAKLMLVGEAPGAREDESGRPFVGRSGDLLTTLLSGIGLSRSDVFITSVLKSRPPKNRTPTRSEIEACRPYLERQIEIINPQIVVLLGGVAVSSIIGPWKMAEAHGKFYEGGERTFFITYHPAAALRFPRIKDVMIADFDILKQELR